MTTANRPMIKREGFLEMNPNRVVFNLGDNGGRRSGIERRRFSYAIHVPERRSDEDRRSDLDRRSEKDRRTCVDRRSAKDRRNGVECAVAVERRRGKDRRAAEARRSGMDRRDFMVL